LVDWAWKKDVLVLDLDLEALVLGNLECTARMKMEMLKRALVGGQWPVL
jgi:hypothetical protein